MSEIYDNIEKKFLDGLKGIIHNDYGIVKRVDFCVGYFNLRGWRHIVDEIEQLPGDDIREPDDKGKLVLHHRTCRLLIGMYKSPKDLIYEEYSTYTRKVDIDYTSECIHTIAKDFRDQLCIGVPTEETERSLQKLLSQLKSGKVVIKLCLKHQLHAKLYIAHRDDKTKIHAIMGSSNLTQGGFDSNGELNALFEDSDHVDKLDKWFNDRWNERFCVDISQELIQAIENSWATPDNIPPYYIYLKTVYHLSEDARAGFNEFSIPREFEGVLFEFQATAVKLAARRLEQQGGCMIGDVVGLGKTMTACAIAKMYENNYGTCTLILCPANLQQMWKDYIRRYDLKADVLSIDKKFNSSELRYYRLCIIDESHNLRNSEGKRYKRIRELMELQNSRVLLLTATAYNKSYYDISSQLRLFIGDDKDIGIRPENYIQSIGGEHEFAKQHSNTHIRSIQAFEKSHDPDDWANLMKHFLVRRTRTFIKDNYAKTDPDNHRKYLEYPDKTKSYFPDRLPHAIKFIVSNDSQYARLYSDQMLELLGKLKLPRYGMNKYIDKEKTKNVEKYIKQIIDNLSKAGERMMGFCKSTLYKRLDSSGYAFLLTLKRHLLRNQVYLFAIDNHQPLPIGDTNDVGTFYDETIDDEDGENNDFPDEVQNISLNNARTMDDYKLIAERYYHNLYQAKLGNIKWLDSQYAKDSLKKDLTKDCKIILQMLELCGNWQSDKDPKIDELYRLLTTTHKKDKVLIFTQYADTAEYLCRELQNRKLNQIAFVTGNSNDISETVYRFAPENNPQSKNTANDTLSPIRILIATDVLSEGQNLQDSHVIINFDLPWAIIRLIQRAGRVDRIGQKSNTIDCYSFFPADGIESIINLRRRLNTRINENAQVLGSDEEFFEGNETNLRNLYNEKAGILDDDESDIDVDTASMAYQIWKAASEAKPELVEIIKKMGNVSYSTKAAKDKRTGVITYVRTYNNFDVLTWMSENNEVLSQSQNAILKALACAIDEPAIKPMSNHHDIVKATVAHVRDQSMNFKYAGALGSPNSTRKRIHDILDEQSKQQTSLFFTPEDKRLVKAALDAVYQSPLLSSAQDILQRMMREKKPATDIVKVTVDLYLKRALCPVSEERTKYKDPMILCSMGLRPNE